MAAQANGLLTRSADGLYASVYLRSAYPRPAAVRWARDKIIGRGAAVYAYIVSILPNLVQLIVSRSPRAWDSVGKALRGILLIFVPAFLLNSAYLIPAALFVVVAVVVFLLARRDKRREGDALQRQQAQREAEQREALQAQQQQEIKRVIEQQLRRWYGGSSVVAALPEQAVERQPDDVVLLPPAAQPLVARDEDVQWLVERLYPRPARMIALYGPAGSGKTSVVAAALAHAREHAPDGPVRDRFPDGIAVIDCSRAQRGETLLTVALARFAPVGVARADEAGLPDVALHVLKGNQLLLVLDNLPANLEAPERLFQPLRDAGIAVLAVAREPLDDEFFPIGAYRQLGPLASAPAQAVLANAAGAQATPQSVAAVAPLLGGNPLALTLIGRYAQATGRPLDMVARELTALDRRASDAARPLARPIAVEQVAAYVIERLPAPAHRLFVALAAHPTMTLSEELASGYAGQALRAPRERPSALGALVAWGLLTPSQQQGVGGNLYTQTVARELAQRRFAALPRAARRAAWRRLVSLCIASQSYKVKAVASPDQAAYLELIRQASATRATSTLIALCSAAAAAWRDGDQYEALLVYLPLGLRAIDRGRASAWPWRWLKYRLPHMRQRYYRLLYYYADGLRQINQLLYARTIFQRSLHIARFRRDTVGKAEIYGGLAAVAQAESEQLEARTARVAAVAQANVEYQQVITLVGSRTLTDRVAKDLANAYVGLGRNALKDSALDDTRDPAERRAAAERLESQGLAIMLEAARRPQPDRSDRLDHSDRSNLDDTFALLYTDLAELALQSDDPGRFDRAQQWYQQALNHTSQAAKPDQWMAYTQNLVGVDLQRGDAATARQRLEQGAARWHALGDPLGEGLARFNLGLFLNDHGDLEGAQTQLASSSKLLRRAHDRQTEATATLNLGSVLLSQGQVDSAENAVRQSLVTFRETTNPWGTSGAFMKLGEIALQRGQFTDAEDLFTEARRIALTERNREVEARILIGLGETAQAHARFELARSSFQEAFDIFTGMEEPLEIAMALMYLANLASARNEFTTALTSLSQAEAVYRQQKSTANDPEIKRARGQIAYLRGEVAPAERLLTEALTEHHTQGNRDGEGETLINLGMLALDRGEADTAREQFAHATTIFHQADARDLESKGLLYQGLAALAQGQIEGPTGADCLLDSAYDHFCDIGDHTLEGLAQTWRGRLAFMRGRADDAARRLSDGLERAEATRNGRTEVVTRLFQAELRAAGAAPAALGPVIETLRAALTLAHECEYPLGEGMTHSTLSALSLRAGDLASATAHNAEALRLLEATQARPQHALALCRHAQMLATQGDVAGASAPFRAAVEAIRAVQDAYLRAQITRDAGEFFAQQSPNSPEARALLSESAEIAQQCGFALIASPAPAGAPVAVPPGHRE